MPLVLPQPTPGPWCCSFAPAFRTGPDQTGVPQGTAGPLRPVGSRARLLAAGIPGPGTGTAGGGVAAPEGGWAHRPSPGLGSVRARAPGQAKLSGLAGLELSFSLAPRRGHRGEEPWVGSRSVGGRLPGQPSRVWRRALSLYWDCCPTLGAAQAWLLRWDPRHRGGQNGHVRSLGGVSRCSFGDPCPSPAPALMLAAGVFRGSLAAPAAWLTLGAPHLPGQLQGGVGGAWLRRRASSCPRRWVWGESACLSASQSPWEGGPRCRPGRAAQSVPAARP